MEPYKKINTAEILAKIKLSEQKRKAELKKANTTETNEELHFMDIDAKTEYDTQGAANEIWLKVKPLRLTPWMSQPYDIKIDMFHKKFPKFCTTFPVVIKYMINDGIFCHKAFERYLKKLKACSPKSKEEWAERQADYIKYCIMNMDNKHDKVERANRAWTDVKKGLMDDMDDMKKEMDLAKELASKDVKELAEKRRSDIKTLIRDDPEMKKRIVDLLARKQEQEQEQKLEETNDKPTTVWMTMKERDEYLKAQKQ